MVRESARCGGGGSLPEQSGTVGRLTLADTVGSFDGFLADLLRRREERGCTKRERERAKYDAASSAPRPRRRRTAGQNGTGLETYRRVERRP